MKRPHCGHTLIELTVSLGLFAVLTLVLFVLLNMGLRTWDRIEARGKVQRELRQSGLRLIDDLKQTSATQVRTAAVAGGQVLWFPTAVDFQPSSLTYKQILRNPDTGEPLWQSTVLYYSAIPDHGGTGIQAHFNCSGNVLDAFGLDTSCPHKVLIRKMIDIDPPTSMDGTSGEEPLIADVTPWVTAPTNYGSVVKMHTQPSVIRGESRLVSRELLYFRVPQTTPLVTFDIRVVRLVEAQRKITMGNSDLTVSPFTSFSTASVQPGNL